jgi:hypothetical protein
MGDETTVIRTYKKLNAMRVTWRIFMFRTVYEQFCFYPRLRYRLHTILMKQNGRFRNFFFVACDRKGTRKKIPAKQLATVNVRACKTKNKNKSLIRDDAINITSGKTPVVVPDDVR